jgi:hypothetical protein
MLDEPSEQRVEWRLTRSAGDHPDAVAAVGRDLCDLILVVRLVDRRPDDQDGPDQHRRQVPQRARVTLAGDRRWLMLRQGSGRQRSPPAGASGHPLNGMSWLARSFSRMRAATSGDEPANMLRRSCRPAASRPRSFNKPAAASVSTKPSSAETAQRLDRAGAPGLSGDRLIEGEPVEPGFHAPPGDRLVPAC